jgi:hypothetical protein
MAARPILTIGQQCHLVAHQDALKPALTAAKTSDSGAIFSGGGDVAAALAAFDLGGACRAPGRLLSAGQKRRLALSRLALTAEPVASRRADGRARPRLAGAAGKLMAAHLDHGGLMIVATHVDIGLDEPATASIWATWRWPAMNGLIALVRRDVLLALRQGGGAGTAIGFFLTVVVLLPLGIGPDLALLQRIAPGRAVDRAAAVGAAVGGTHFPGRLRGRLARTVHHGSGSARSRGRAKAVAHWLTAGLPLALAAPLLGFLLNLAPGLVLPLALAMVTGSLPCRCWPASGRR